MMTFPSVSYFPIRILSMNSQDMSCKALDSATWHFSCPPVVLVTTSRLHEDGIANICDFPDWHENTDNDKPPPAGSAELDGLHNHLPQTKLGSEQMSEK